MDVKQQNLLDGKRKGPHFVFPFLVATRAPFGLAVATREARIALDPIRTTPHTGTGDLVSLSGTWGSSAK